MIKMATEKTVEIEDSASDASSQFSALRLLAPPLRLVSAAMWKVIEERNVLQYGTVEDFVTSACESVQGLLTSRHQAKLALGLRARFILELCSGQGPLDLKVILQHLEKVRSPVSSLRGGRKDIKIEKTVANFRLLVRSLTKDASARELFYMNTFPVEYGPQFDQELKKLLWEFLVRLDQLLPVPNLAQTVSWLCAAPAVLDECAHAASQPQLLKTLLQYQSYHGHLESAVNVPQHMGDSILTSLSLSLPPSGRVPQNQLSGSTGTSVGSKGVSTTAQTVHSEPLVSPVMGHISMPLMCLARKSLGHPDSVLPSTSRDMANNQSESSKRPKFTALKQRTKPAEDGRREEDEGGSLERSVRTRSRDRRKPGSENKTLGRESDDSMEEEVVRVTQRGTKRIWRNSRESVNTLQQKSRSCGLDGNTRVAESNDGGTTDRGLLQDCLVQRGLKGLKLPKDPALCPLLMSCLHSQPRVQIASLQLHAITDGSLVTPSLLDGSGCSGNQAGGLPVGEDSQILLGRTKRKRKSVDSPVWFEVERPDRSDKENCAVSTSATQSPSFPAIIKGTTLSPEAGEDIIGDSEDEATKKVRGKLFVKRYCRTKHDTYVPTLREFWKPGFARRDLLSTGTGHR